MKYFLDTEFIEDGKTIDLLSIGIVCEDGRELYLASSEADRSKANDWVKEHVLPHLPPPGSSLLVTRFDIRDLIMDFARPNEEPEFWGYFADYDWVAFCQLFGRMIDLPKGYPMFCMDLKQRMKELGVKKADLPPQTQTAHIAITDARWNADVYRYLQAVTARRSLARSWSGAQNREEKAVEDIIAEYLRARSLFKPLNSAHEGYAVILEEVDELWELVKGKRGPENARAMRKEAVQVAAMAIAHIIDCCDAPAPADTAPGKTGIAADASLVCQFCGIPQVDAFDAAMSWCPSQPPNNPHSWVRKRREV